MRIDIEYKINQLQHLKRMDCSIALKELEMIFSEIETAKQKECNSLFPLQLEKYHKDVYANTSFYEVVLKSLDTCMSLCKQSKRNEVIQYLNKAILHMEYID